MRQHADFIFFERAERRGRSKGRSSTSSAPRTRTPRPRRRSSGWPRCTWPRPGRAWRATAATPSRSPRSRTSSRTSPRTSAGSSSERVAAEPSHLKRWSAFAERAYRRPLTGDRARRPAGVLPLAARRGRAGPRGRDARRARQRADVAALLLPASIWSAAGGGAQPLSDYALASRLSYFLWSSMPDDELLARAAAGDLHQPEVLAAQARRMLRDDARPRRWRSSSAATGSTSAASRSTTRVDRERFPSFDDELRQAMFEEPVRFFVDVVQQRSLGARFPVRQAHVRQPGAGQALRHARRRRRRRTSGCASTTPTAYGRGGLLPMAVFLTQERARACAPAR